MSENPEIEGELALQTLAMPKDTNANGDIFGGWLVSQMDLAAGIKVADGLFVFVAIDGSGKPRPLPEA
jgi:acyl-CoA thioesterase YciA